jgi:predicted nucleic acid-binding protein
MNCYLDTSVVVALVLRDSHTAKAEAWLEHAAPACIVSDFCVIEFASVVSRQVRMSHLSRVDGSAVLDLFDEWIARTAQVVTSSGEHMEAAGRMIRDFDTKLSAPDAIHLAVAKHRGLVLVTFDQRLSDAARRENVKIVVPE